MSYALGIDLGTTYTAAAIFVGGQALTVPMGPHGGAIPSLVFVGDDGFLIGEHARQRGDSEPSLLQSEFKRRLGEETDLIVGSRTVSAAELMGELARWVIQRTTELQGGPPDQIVVTCPANWGKYRQDALARAVNAVLNEQVQCTMISEPEAAAVYYATRDKLPVGACIAVYDLGGGTFDVAILRKGERKFSVVGRPKGNNDIGGIDVDRVLLDHVLTLVGIDLGSVDRTTPQVARQISTLRQRVSDAKILLSDEPRTVVAVDIGSISTTVQVNRSELDNLCRPLITRTIQTLEDALRSAKVTASDLHSLLLVGGASRMPLVSELISAKFAVRKALDAHPKFAVCLGAAIVAGSQTSGTIVERALDLDDLPPTQAANLAQRGPAPDLLDDGPRFDQPPALADIETAKRPSDVDDLPPLLPANRQPMPAVTPPVPLPEQPNQPPPPPPAEREDDGWPADAVDILPSVAAPPVAPLVLWADGTAVANIDLAAAGLLGLADVPATPVARVQVDRGRDLKQAEDIVITADTPRDGRQMLVVAAIVAVVLALLLIAIISSRRAEASARPNEHTVQFALTEYPTSGGF